MNLSGLNLNLLVALDALLVEFHVTSAGKRVGLSQPAMSTVLKQLREIYHDELLLRGQGSRMQLTDLALSLREPVRTALQQVEIAFSGHQIFEAKTSSRTFHVGMSDYISFVLLPKLIKRLSREAPDVKLVIHHINRLSSYQPFESQPIDLILGNFAKAPRSLMCQRLFSDKGVCVARKEHALFKRKKITIADLAKHKHVMVSYMDDPQDTFLDQIFREHGLNVTTRFVVPHALMALYVLPGTDLVTHTVSKIAEPLLTALKLRAIDSPFFCPDYVANQYWQPRHNNDSGHQWMRQLIKDLANRDD